MCSLKKSLLSSMHVYQEEKFRTKVGFWFPTLKEVQLTILIDLPLFYIQIYIFLILSLSQVSSCDTINTNPGNQLNLFYFVVTTFQWNYILSLQTFSLKKSMFLGNCSQTNFLKRNLVFIKKFCMKKEVSSNNNLCAKRPILVMNTTCPGTLKTLPRSRKSRIL